MPPLRRRNRFASGLPWLDWSQRRPRTTPVITPVITLPLRPYPRPPPPRPDEEDLDKVDLSKSVDWAHGLEKFQKVLSFRPRSSGVHVYRGAMRGRRKRAVRTRANADAFTRPPHFTHIVACCCLDPSPPPLSLSLSLSCFLAWALMRALHATRPSSLAHSLTIRR